MTGKFVQLCTAAEKQGHIDPAEAKGIREGVLHVGPQKMGALWALSDDLEVPGFGDAVRPAWSRGEQPSNGVKKPGTLAS